MRGGGEGFEPHPPLEHKKQKYIAACKNICLYAATVNRGFYVFHTIKCEFFKLKLRQNAFGNGNSYRQACAGC